MSSLILGFAPHCLLRHQLCSYLSLFGMIIRGKQVYGHGDWPAVDVTVRLLKYPRGKLVGRLGGLLMGRECSR